jgi:hypothetical protein
VTAHLRKSKDRPQRTSSHSNPRLIPAAQKPTPTRTSHSAFPQLSPPLTQQLQQQRVNQLTTLPVINKRGGGEGTRQVVDKENNPQLIPTPRGADRSPIQQTESAPSTPTSPLKAIKNKIQQLENQLHRQRKVLPPPPHRLLSPCHSCLLSLPLTSQRISNPIPRKPHDRNGPNWKLLKTRSREFLDILDPLCLSSTRHERCDLNSTFQSNSKICSQPQLNVSLTLPLPPLNTSNISLSLPPTRRTRHLQRVPPLLHSLHLSLRDQHPHH